MTYIVGSLHHRSLHYRHTLPPPWLSIIIGSYFCKKQIDLHGWQFVPQKPSLQTHSASPVGCPSSSVVTTCVIELNIDLHGWQFVPQKPSLQTHSASPVGCPSSSVVTTCVIELYIDLHGWQFVPQKPSLQTHSASPVGCSSSSVVTTCVIKVRLTYKVDSLHHRSLRYRHTLPPPWAVHRHR